MTDSRPQASRGLVRSAGSRCRGLLALAHVFLDGGDIEFVDARRTFALLADDGNVISGGNGGARQFVGVLAFVSSKRLAVGRHAADNGSVPMVQGIIQNAGSGSSPGDSSDQSSVLVAPVAPVPVPVPYCANAQPQLANSATPTNLINRCDFMEFPPNEDESSETKLSCCQWPVKWRSTFCQDALGSAF